MIEWTYHEVLSTVVHELLHPLLAVLTPHMRLYKQLHWTRLMSKRRSLWAKNRLQVKYIYKQRQINKWYISLKLILPSAFMCVERDGAAGVHGHRTMIFPVPVVGAGLWAPDCERRENRFEVMCSIYAVHISPEMNGGLNSRQIATSFHPSRLLSLACLFDVFLVSYQKSRNLLPK
jgi:hypothetical protein